MDAINMSSVAWVMTSTALVMIMLPGLSLFYSGLVRGKNALATAMHSFTCLGIVLIVWVLWGYSLAFGPSVGGIIGNLDHVLLNGVGLEPRPGQDIPELLFMLFQGMFAVITPALLAGAIAERVKFRAFGAFVVLWVTFVYCPIAHWVWGGGWLHGIGASDFAGGFAVHMSSGVAALAAARILGRRQTADGETALCNRTASCSCCWELVCSGSAGLDSMAAARWRRTASLCKRWSTPTWPRPPAP